MSNKIIAPIVVEINDKRYKLIYLNFSKDGSVYLTFPRKRGYYTELERRLKNSQDKEHPEKINLNPVEVTAHTPYLSFHPGKNILHINDTSDTILQRDGEVINYSSDPGKIAFPFFQLIIPRFDCFDELTTERYDKPLVIQASKFWDQGVAINLEIWIHPKGDWLDIEELPPKNVRRDMVSFRRYIHPDIPKYSCTVLLSKIVKERGEGIEGPILYVATKEWHYFVKFIPN